jgi:hypothetical protein
MASAAHSDSISTEAWQATTIADFHPKDMYTTSLSTRPDGAHIAVTQHPATPTRGVLAVRPVDDTDGWWLLHELRSRSSDITQAAQGRNAREISARALSRLSVTWPGSTTRASFHTMADPLHSVARQLVSKVATLHDLKDALLRDISAKASIVLEREPESDVEHVQPPRPPAIPQPREATTGHTPGWSPQNPWRPE